MARKRGKPGLRRLTSTAVLLIVAILACIFLATRMQQRSHTHAAKGGRSGLTSGRNLSQKNKTWIISSRISPSNFRSYLPTPSTSTAVIHSKRSDGPCGSDIQIDTSLEFQSLGRVDDLPPVDLEAPGKLQVSSTLCEFPTIFPVCIRA